MTTWEVRATRAVFGISKVYGQLFDQETNTSGLTIPFYILSDFPSLDLSEKEAEESEHPYSSLTLTKTFSFS